MRGRRWALIGLAVGLVVTGIFAHVIQPASAQDGTDPRVSFALRQAADFLGKKIGKSIPKVDNFTYELTTFPDAGLGCPADGQTYVPAPTQGYKFVITFGGMAYDLHTTADGVRVVLCSSTPVKTVVSLATYRSPLFSIPYPDRWNFVDRTTDIYFGLGATPVCSQPGMTVTALGAVPADKTADALLDEYAQTTPGIHYEGDRASIGNNGRSALYTAPCTNGAPRTHRVTTFLALGRGYRILQFAPQADFSQWDETFHQILQQFSPGAAGSAVNGGLAVRQPEQSPLAMIAHVFAGNVYVGTLADLPGTPITTDAASDHVYRDIAISPSGDRLAFVDPASETLLVASGKTGTARKIADKLAPHYPVAWSPDGSEVAYLADQGQHDGDHSVYALMAVKPDGQDARKIGDTPRLLSECSGNTADPAEQLYWSETGLVGNELLLAWARTGVIYFSLGCDGIGVGQLPAKGGNGGVVNDRLRRARLSPDGTELLGIVGGPNETPGLVRLHLPDGNLSAVTTAAPPDQVAWSADGKAIFYATAMLKDTVTLDDPSMQERGLKAFGVWPFQTRTYDVTLHRIDLTSGVDAPLYAAVGRAIGHIAPSPDGSGVLFTLVRGASELVEAFKSNVSPGDLRRQAPSIALYWLPLPDGQALLVAITADPTWGPPGSAAAPTPTSGPNQPTPTARPVIRATSTPPPPPPTNTRQPGATTSP